MTQKALTTVVIILLIVLIFAHPAKAQTERDFAWVNNHFQDVLNRLMPIGGYTLGYRSYRDLYTDELEYSFIFDGDSYDQDLSATFRIADKTSIYDQIMASHRKKPAASISEIVQDLKLQEWRFTETSCPAIRSQFEQFYSLSLETMSSQEKADRQSGRQIITLHPREHYFESRVTGGRLRLVMENGEHPFVVWAEATRQALSACARKSNAPKK